MTVKEHYDNHLANFYSWMIGDFEKAKDSFKDFCTKNEIKPVKSGNAIDLGAGTGVQSIALGEIGFRVEAVDFNEKLFSELKTRISDLPVRLVQEDMRNIKTITNSPVEVIVCCGDTISHLETFEQLETLIQDCFDLLEVDGCLILSFRDYSSALKGIQRFIPVKSDEDRILTCVMDFSDEKVRVTDLLHEKNNGNWLQKVSSYDKLRIQTDYLVNKSEEIGFSLIEKKSIHQIIHLILKK